ncbi:MAG: biotin/lipoyl-binding protein [Myxococcota bacterium]
MMGGANNLDRRGSHERALWCIAALLLYNGAACSGGGRNIKERSPAPVESAAIERGTITLRRTFSGTLEAPTRFVAAPKVPGRVERLHVNLSDTVKRGALIAELDNAEYVHGVTQAKADLAVAQANYEEAKASFDTTQREVERMNTLKKRV